MERRNFLKWAALSGLASPAMPFSFATETPATALAPANYRRRLILIELKGGNDGLNTVVPYADPAYFEHRPRLAIPRDQVIQLDDRYGLHPSLEAVLPLWKDGQLGLIQGIGYPSPNLSHFRSIEIWDTASKSDTYLQDGWLTRAFAAAPTPSSFAADGVIVGSNELGPLAGIGTRAIALNNTEQFLRQARLATPHDAGGNRAMAHILKVETDVRWAASGLAPTFEFKTEFPKSDFGNSVKTACQVMASRAGVAVVRLTLGGFDTHQNQLPVHARLLRDLAEGIVAFRSALTEMSQWDDTLLLTYAEFGRRVRENMSGGTDHGTASAHFAAGGRVTGGFHGVQPSLARLDGAGNVQYAVDFRSVYATVLERWWSVPSHGPLGGNFSPVEFLSI